MITLENTLENKAKFFAQYWGQRIMKSDMDGLGLRSVNHNFIYPLHKEDADYLLLTPLSQITDEDAIEIWGMMWELHEYRNTEDLYEAQEWMRNYGKPNFVKLNQEQADYLRSKSYAVDWHNVKVDEQINRGWIKLKQQD